MVSTFTPNIQLEEPARGDQVGVWDTPVNSNMTLVDLVVGGITTIGLNNSPVVLSAAQFKSRMITFNSTLTGSVAITFPTSFTKSYDIQNLCTGSSAFSITLQTTAAGGQVIACPFGETIECFNDATNIKFKNLGRVGQYLDIAYSSVPSWISACTVPPYLNCDGSAFSAATYPVLAIILGSTTLPDFRGRGRLTANQGTARLSSAGAGIDGNTLFATGGANGVLLSTSQLPTHTSVNATQAITVTSTATNIVSGTVAAAQVGTGGFSADVLSPGTGVAAARVSSGSNSISVAFTNASQGTVGLTAPSIISGITMIRSA